MLTALYLIINKIRYFVYSNYDAKKNVLFLLLPFLALLANLLIDITVTYFLKTLEKFSIIIFFSYFLVLLIVLYINLSNSKEKDREKRFIFLRNINESYTNLLQNNKLLILNISIIITLIFTLNILFTSYNLKNLSYFFIKTILISSSLLFYNLFKYCNKEEIIISTIISSIISILLFIPLFLLFKNLFFILLFLLYIFFTALTLIFSFLYSKLEISDRYNRSLLYKIFKNKFLLFLNSIIQNNHIFEFVKRNFLQILIFFVVIFVDFLLKKNFSFFSSINLAILPIALIFSFFSYRKQFIKKINLFETKNLVIFRNFILFITFLLLIIPKKFVINFTPNTPLNIFKDLLNPIIVDLNKIFEKLVFINNTNQIVLMIAIVFLSLLSELLYFLISKIKHYYINFSEKIIRKKYLNNSTPFFLTTNLSFYNLFLFTIGILLSLYILYFQIPFISNIFITLFETLQVREVFKIKFLTNENIKLFFDIIFKITYYYFLIKIINLLFKTIFSFFIISDDNIIFIDFNFITNKITRIKYNSIKEIKIKQNLINFLLNNGKLIILTNNSETTIVNLPDIEEINKKINYRVKS